MTARKMGSSPTPTTFKIHQVAMVGGEVAPSLWYRHDLEKIKVSLAQCRNFIPMPHGGVTFRPGTWHVAETKDSGKVALIAMGFSNEASVHIEAGDGYFRFHVSGAPVELELTDTDAWVTATEYSAYDYVNDGTDIYRCILEHTSSATDEPGVGANSDTYWVKSSVYEIESPYATADLGNIRYVQSADALFLADGSHQPRVLSRYSNKNWEIDTYDFENGPFLSENSGDTTLSVSTPTESAEEWYSGRLYFSIFSQYSNVVHNGTYYSCLKFHFSDSTNEPGLGSSWTDYWRENTGLAGDGTTVTASDAIFDADDVGRWIRIRYMSEGEMIHSGSQDPSSAGYIAGPWSVDGRFEVTYYFSDRASKYVDLYYSVDNGSNWEVLDSYSDVTKDIRVTKEYALYSEDYNDVVPQIRLRASGDCYRFYWKIKYIREERYGFLKIIDYMSSTSVTATIHKKFDHYNKPTKRWSWGSWGDVPGWPSVVTFHQDRLTWANSATSPFDIWQSVVGDYYNFDSHLPVLDDDAVTIPIRSRSLDYINGIVSLKDMIVLTSGGEWRVSGSSEGNAITPDSMYVSNQGYRGSYNLDPMMAGSSILFVQRFGTRIRDLSYSFESDGYDSNDLSIFATHLFDGYTVSGWCWQQEPWNVLWVVRSDGALLALTYMKEQDVWAWHMHTTEGEVEAVSCAPGLYEDEVYMVVKRSVDGSDVRFIEKLAAKSEQLHLDCSIEAHDGEATTSITGLDYLEGEDIVVLADGVPVFGHTVSSGSITLDKAAEYVVAGLSFTGRIQTLPMMYEAKEGMSTGARRRAVEIILQLSESQKGYVGTDDDDMYPISYSEAGEFSGVASEILSSEYDYAAQVTVEQRHPLPFTILTWTVKVAHGD